MIRPISVYDNSHKISITIRLNSLISRSIIYHKTYDNHNDNHISFIELFTLIEVRFIFFTTSPATERHVYSSFSNILCYSSVTPE